MPSLVAIDGFTWKPRRSFAGQILWEQDREARMPQTSAAKRTHFWRSKDGWKFGQSAQVTLTALGPEAVASRGPTGLLRDVVLELRNEPIYLENFL
jgi:hypothetical protein